MPEKLGWRLKVRNVKREIGVGINDEPNRGTFALLPGNSHIIFAGDHLAAGICSALIVTLANQDQGRNGHRSLKAAAYRIERSRRSKLVVGCLLNRPRFNR
jgi:hypothetical protein